MKNPRRQLLNGLLGAGAIAVLVAAYAFVQLLSGSAPIDGSLPLVASFGCFGLLLGAIFLFDAPTDFGGTNRPLVRVGVSGLSGLSLSLLWHWPLEGAALSTMVSAALGYFGITWAKYVDF